MDEKPRVSDELVAATIKDFQNGHVHECGVDNSWEGVRPDENNLALDLQDSRAEVTALRARVAWLEGRVNTASLEIKRIADNYYVTGLRQHEKPECLGSVYKMENGKFRAENYEALKTGNDMVAKHFGLYEILPIVKSILDEPEAV